MNQVDENWHCVEAVIFVAMEFTLIDYCFQYVYLRQLIQMK